MKKITTKPASGFRDYLPEEMILRQEMIDTVRNVFERFGFVPIDTPAIEREEVLTGGDTNFKKEIFKTNKQKGDSALALRFDLTVPLARVVAEHWNTIKKPFKRYHIGKVWRGERPQAGRYREFLQCDADIVGSSSTMADAEIIAIIDSVLSSLGIENFVIRINNRKVLETLAEYAGFPKKKIPSVLRSIDKLDKQGWPTVARELRTGGLTKEQTERIGSFVEFRESNPEKVLNFARYTLGKAAEEGIRELREIKEHLAALGVPREHWVFDLPVARGLGYYTGPVFEAVIKDAQEFGSVMSGGRYDNLIGAFSNVSVPAVGASAGLDRLFAAISATKAIRKKRSVVQVTVLNFDLSAATYVEHIATELRKNGFATDLYLGNETNLRAQLAYALHKESPVVIIAGREEKEKRTAQIKNIQKKEQKEVSLGELISVVRSILDKK